MTFSKKSKEECETCRMFDEMIENLRKNYFSHRKAHR